MKISKGLMLFGFCFLIVMILLVIYSRNYFINKEEVEKVKESISSGVSWLSMQQNKDGSVSLDDDSFFKIWETANSILAIAVSGCTEFNTILDGAENFLIKVKRSDNSFYHNITQNEEEYCIETTSIALIALDLSSHDVTDIKEFILLKQSKTGEWDIGNPHLNTLSSVTGSALSALGCLNEKGEHIEKALDYLRKTQFNNGSWLSTPQYYDTPYHQIYPNVLAFCIYNYCDSDTVKKALNFVISNQNEDGSWGNPENISPSKELRTALALNTLLISDISPFNQSVQKGIKWLLEQQKEDGRWYGGYFKGLKNKREDILATSLSILALERYNGRLKNKKIRCLNK